MKPSCSRPQCGHASSTNTSSIRWRCARCNHYFTDNEALCENWEDPKRNFICPKCESYLSKFPPPLSKRDQQRQNLKQVAVIVGYAVLIIALVSLYTVVEEKFWRLRGIYWLIVAGGVALWISKRRPKRWQNTYLVGEKQRIDEAEIVPIKDRGRANKDETH